MAEALPSGALEAYFDRIGYRGDRSVDYDTLDGIMKAHVAEIPFENLDVQLGRPVRMDLVSIHAKLVGARRGGWCYEQNGLLGWALGELGFDVRRMSAGVMRSVGGDFALGNHLTLAVTLDRVYLVDAGFGGSQAGPIPLEAGMHAHPPFDLILSKMDDGFWRFEEQIDGKPFNFDFTDGPADEALLAEKCEWLQTDPESPFTLNLVVQQRQGDAHHTLRGRVYSSASPRGTDRQELADADELVALLQARFGLDLPEVASLWPAICARHDAVMAGAAS